MNRTENRSNWANYIYNVIVIGGGSAGLRAAIEAYDNGSDVVIISKSKQSNLIQCLLELELIRYLEPWAPNITGYIKENNL
ncbi:MAG: FAD-binding protein [Candidatus Nitrosocosmicus sp.]